MMNKLRKLRKHTNTEEKMGLLCEDRDSFQGDEVLGEKGRRKAKSLSLFKSALASDDDGKIAKILHDYSSHTDLLISFFEMSLRQSNLKAVKLITPKRIGCNVNIVCMGDGLKFMSQPIHIAAEVGSVEIVSYLIAVAANVDLQNGIKFTPLHIAASLGNMGVIKLLYENCNADINVINNSGFTPIASASCHGREEVVFYLAKNGADINVSDCARLAISRGHNKLFRQLTKLEQCTLCLNFVRNFISELPQNIPRTEIQGALNASLQGLMDEIPSEDASWTKVKELLSISIQGLMGDISRDPGTAMQGAASTSVQKVLDKSNVQY